jgi:hypothetical protein
MRTPEEKLLNPRPGSKLAEVRDYGIDLSLIAENMRLSPEDRIRRLQQAMTSFEKLQREASKSRRIDQ